ncbi:MAG: hypothetical protein SAJ12_07245 [Jaaginema sp. PMC 1079.18]|nr:hypothetical protein [Jaaginema sp. PMC 1080.18]MEC4850792.1 hypothetical protein [Jaaginema sp. PMC 1079.18]MEC4866367.1 hypothetical protein [Jaaginema sp. PMC 1078.18]
MSFVLKAKQLAGYITRNEKFKGLTKSFNLTALKGGMTEYAKGESKGWFVKAKNWIWEETNSIIGELWAGAKALLWSAQKIVQISKMLFDYVWTFDWNVSEETVKAGYQAVRINAAGAIGRVSGRTLGFIVAGAISGTALMTINKSMALYALQMAREDQQDEILEELASSTKSVAGQFAANLIKHAYRGIKFWGRDQAAAIAEIWEAAGWAEPGMAEHIRNVYSEKSEPCSFSSKYNEWKESKSPATEEFLDEFGDEFSDAFWDTLICIGSSVDQFHAQSALVENSRTQSRSELVTLEISPA